MRSLNTLVVGILLATGASCVQAQGTPAAGGAKPAAPVAKSSSHAAKGTAKAKPVTSATPAADSGSAAGPAAQGESGGGESSAGTEMKLSRRDPFESLVNRQKDAGAGKNLPPGKAGLQVSTLRLDGIVRSSNGMIAVVSNPQARTYFLREGDQLYDGRVEKIAMDGVSFHEIGKDAFGKPVERQVNKRIYASAGEQQ
jgi:hypothetical protein